MLVEIESYTYGEVLKNEEGHRCSGELFFFSKKKTFEMMELSSKSVIFVAKICRSVNKKAEVFAE